MIRTVIAISFGMASSIVFAEACLIELNIKQLGIYDKSCQENHQAPANIFKTLCDSHKNQENIKVTDLKSCPQDYLAYCELNFEYATGGFRTYIYSAESVAALKQSCFANVGGVKHVNWVQKKK